MILRSRPTPERAICAARWRRNDRESHDESCKSEGGACGFVQRPTARAASPAARGTLAGVEPDGSCHPWHTVVAIVSVLDGSAGVQRPTFSSTAARSGRPTRRARDADGVHRTSLAAELRGRCAGNSDLPRQTPSWPWRTCTRPGRGRFRISRRARKYAAEQSRPRGGEGPPADCAGTRGAWRRHHHDPLQRQVIITAPDLPICARGANTERWGLLPSLQKCGTRAPGLRADVIRCARLVTKWSQNPSEQPASGSALERSTTPRTGLDQHRWKRRDASVHRPADRVSVTVTPCISG
jgi:hypothetical protein